MARFKSCQNDGASMLQQRSSLTGIAVVVDGHPSTPKDVLALCAQQQEATAELLRKVEGLISFEDGPKQSFEKAKGLLAKGAKSDALAQFRECIATGRILDHFNPELKDRKFEVAGASLTLVELIEQCVKQRDALDTK